MNGKGCLTVVAALVLLGLLVNVAQRTLVVKTLKLGTDELKAIGWSLVNTLIDVHASELGRHAGPSRHYGIFGPRYPRWYVRSVTKRRSKASMTVRVAQERVDQPGRFVRSFADLCLSSTLPPGA